MKIETKFDIGQKVWFVDLWVGIKEVVISGIEIWRNKMVQNEVLSDFVKMSKMLEEKDQHIKELEKENENKSELGLALYIALAKELEKQGMIDNIPSAIDQLVGKNCGIYADMYSEYRCLKRELELYKKALELSCEFLRDMNMKVYGTEGNWQEFYLDKAKENLKNDR